MRAHKSLSLVLGKIIHFVLKLISIWLKTNYSLNNFTQIVRDRERERELHSFASLAMIEVSALAIDKCNSKKKKQKLNT